MKSVQTVSLKGVKHAQIVKKEDCKKLTDYCKES